MNKEESAQLKTQIGIIRRNSRGPVTWGKRAHSYKIEWRTHVAVLKAGRAAKTPPIRFCVFAPSRTGSTLLLDLANSHPDIQCEANAKQTELLRDTFLSPRAFIEARAKLCPAHAYGFKTKIVQLAFQDRIYPPKFLQSLHADGWQMIYLTRRNRLRQALSLAIARQSAVWHRVRDENGVVRNAENGLQENAKVELDISFLIRALEKGQINHDCSERIWSTIPHLKLEYEDNLFTSEQQTSTMVRVFDYLGVPPHAVKTRFERTGASNWRDAISNPHLVEDALRGTPYEEFLDAP